MEPFFTASVTAAEHWDFPRMMDDEYPRPDNGSVLNMAVAAVMLVVAGLGLMVWDDQPESQIVTSALHAP